MFYDNFKRLCEANNEKPTPVAQKLGCTSSNVALWKKGSVPRPAVLQKIADYFGVGTQYLLFGDAENKNPPVPEDERILNEELISRLVSLTPEEMQKVDAFVQGLLANR